MALSPAEYFASPAFNPGIVDWRSFQNEKYQFWQPANPLPSPPPATTFLDKYFPAIPAWGVEPPRPGLYSSTAAAADFLLNGSHGPRSNQQQLWDALGVQALTRAPSVAPIYADLTVRGGGAITGTVWDDFRRSAEFAPTQQILASTVGNIVRIASRTVAKALRKGGPVAYKAAGKLLGVTPTPTGIGLLIVREIGTEIALDYGKRGWRSLVGYMERQQRESHGLPAYQPIGPWQPTYEPTAGIRLPSGTWIGLTGAPRPNDLEFIAFEVDGLKDEVAFLAQTGPTAGPANLMSVGQSLFR
jgi:hypothetical protein